MGRQPSLASTLRVCPQAGKTQMKRSMRPWSAAARTSAASAQRHRRTSEIAKRHGATSTQICARLAHRRSPAMLPILGTLSLGHLRKNLAALEIELTDAELDALG